jgi:hypothetical protein
MFTPHRVAGRRGLAVAASAVLAVGAVACADNSEPDESGTADIELADAENTTASTEAIDTSETVLTDDEIEGLLWMREEEQLAHDVYTTLGDLWGVRIFENIAKAESSHVDSVIEVLDQYGIEDPAAANELGTFTDPQIQNLYDQLVADGSTSLVDALEVGALIEELDITDLRVEAAATDVADITTLYANLEKGSRNHLRAFTSQLETRDVVYEPTYLDEEAYEEIVSSSNERGHDT